MLKREVEMHKKERLFLRSYEMVLEYLLICLVLFLVYKTNIINIIYSKKSSLRQGYGGIEPLI